MKTTLEILKEARELLAKPNGWTQRAFARNASEVKVRACDQDATCFCALGATFTGYYGREGVRARELLDLVVSPTGHRGIVVEFNDAPGRTQAEVLDLFDRAIALAEAAK